MQRILPILALLVWSSADHYAAAVADGTVASYHAAVQTLSKDLDTMTVPHGPSWHNVLSQPVTLFIILYVDDDRALEDIRDDHKLMHDLFLKCDGYSGHSILAYPTSGRKVALALWGWDSVEVGNMCSAAVSYMQTRLISSLMQAYMKQGNENEDFHQVAEETLDKLKNLRHNFGRFQMWP